MIHYLYGSGKCWHPSNSKLHYAESIVETLDRLSEMFDLGPRERWTLLRDYYVALSPSEDTKYCKIVECEFESSEQRTMYRALLCTRGTNMHAYVYRANLWCSDCGHAIRQRLIAMVGEGNEPDWDDEATYDSDDFPKGPYPNGGGEADYAQHCGAGADCLNAVTIRSHGKRVKVGVPLDNPVIVDEGGEA